MFESLLLAVTIVAHDPGYTTSLANHVQRWLGEEQVPARVVTPAEMPAALKTEKIAFLVGFSAPSAAEMKTLRAYRARGGKLVVFHSPSAELGRLMGVRPLGYASSPSPGHWSKMNFDVAVAPKGCPQQIRQSSGGLERIAPVRGRGRTIAGWLDRRGKMTGDAAWVATDAGWWMSHVLLAEGDEDLKAQLCASMCGAVDAKLWTPAVREARERRRREQLTALAAKQVSRKGEIRAVWDHSGQGLYPGDWGRTFRILKAAHVTDLFVNVAGAGFAHYPSSALPRSKLFEQEGDQLTACLKAARGTGVRVHAWVLCFTATRGTPETLADFARKGWRLKNAKGVLTEYLDPSKAAVRGHVFAALDELARVPGLSGVHLDFVRWYEGAKRPAGAEKIIAMFVAEARRRVRKPLWLTAAVLGKYPACVKSVGQDWPTWLDAGTVDYVVPMDYTDSAERFESYLTQHAAKPAHARRTIAGIGVTANESRLDADKVIAQVLAARRKGLAGCALFDLDATLEKRILPFLKMGVW